MNSVVQAAADLVALRRKQYAAVADALDAALALENIVQEQAVTFELRSVEEFLRTAPTEETRAHWAGILSRSTTRVPTDLQET